MEDRNHDQERAATVSRRRAIAGVGAVAGAAWVAPQIISAPAASAATAGPGNVVAVGNAGTIVVTTDAETWTLAVSGVPEDLEDVAYSPTLGLWAAVGADGRVVTSPDGNTWTPRFTPTESRLFAVAWVPFCSRFVAVGNNGNIITSTDGITWNFVFTGVQWPLLGVAANAGAIVVVGEAGTLLASFDGSTFISGGSLTTENLFDIEYAPELGQWLAVGENGTALASSVFGVWEPQATGSTERFQFSVWNAAEAAYVVVSDDAAGSGARFDGTTWTPDATFPPGLIAVTYSFPLSLFIAVGVFGIIATSVHGIFWTPATSPTAQRLNGVAALI